MGHLDTEEYDLPVPDMDLELNYGSEFKKIHDIIIKRLNKTNDKGIILLHGDPGTGKTSYLKYLTKYVQDKDILFIPPSMAEMLSEPSIIPFLMEKKNSILIIEDAERVISDREGNGSPAGVSNILNLTDGILGDCLNIQVIATFNMKRERIDQALLRKGRLIAEHKFEKLPLDETNKLLDHLGKNHKSNEPMSLADIYNVDSDEVRITKEKKSIGFQ
jgi:SpoVK/Ycf46/Vps4 family AAA+-type ATPase